MLCWLRVGSRLEKRILYGGFDSFLLEYSSRTAGDSPEVDDCAFGLSWTVRVTLVMLFNMLSLNTEVWYLKYNAISVFQ